MMTNRFNYFFTDFLYFILYFTNFLSYEEVFLYYSSFSFHDEVCKVNISYIFHIILQHIEGTWKQAGGPNSAPPEVTL